MLLTFARFGAALGLAIVTLLRDAVEDHQLKIHNEELDGVDANETMKVNRIEAQREGLNAAFWLAAGVLIFGESPFRFRTETDTARSRSESNV